MSIKSQLNNLDLSNMTNAKQRDPNYLMNKHPKSKNPYKIQHIDNLHSYVEKNMKKTVKPRNGEYR